MRTTNRSITYQLYNNNAKCTHYSLNKPSYHSTSRYESMHHETKRWNNLVAASSSLQQPTTTTRNTATTSSPDIIVIGAGIGGLCCASLLARYGLNVLVVEAHDVPGGAAHTFSRSGFHFESGPSLYSGMESRGISANPLSLVLQAIDEPLDLLKYDVWNVLLPEVPHGFPARVGPEGFHELITTATGNHHEASDVLEEWKRLLKHVEPLTRAATSIPPASIRLDFGVVQSAALRYLSSILRCAGDLPRMTAPFSDVVDAAGVTTPFIRNYLDLLCFLLSGLPASGTITAEVAFMLNEWLSPHASLEFPKGGSEAMVSALVRGVTKYGGTVRTNSHVEQIVFDAEGRAVGVRLRNGEEISATRAVVSNASSIDTLKLLPETVIPPTWKERVENTPLNPSFMHLHIGFDATGLEESLGMHHLVVNDWSLGVTAPHNVVLISIPSVIDPSLAPPNKHCLHAYYPATEPYHIWENVKRGSDEYKALKEERSKNLWAAIERVIPDIRNRVEISMVGSPLTHARYLRRHQGSYGPAIRAGQGTFPFGTTPIKGLYCVGDYTFPGIGLPAVAASGAVVANTLVPLKKHEELLNSLGL